MELVEPATISRTLSVSGWPPSRAISNSRNQSSKLSRPETSETGLEDAKSASETHRDQYLPIESKSQITQQFKLRCVQPHSVPSGKVLSVICEGDPVQTRNVVIYFTISFLTLKTAVP